MIQFLTINPGDNPNEGRNKINYNFSLITGTTSGSTTGLTGDYLSLTGGTVSGDTNFSGNLSGGTLFSGSTNLGDLFSTHDYHVTGVTFNIVNYQLNINQNDGSSYLADLSILSTDMTVTGGTYDPNTGIGTFSNNSGGTFQVSGFLTGYTDHYVTGGTFSAGTLTLDRQNGSVSISGFTGTPGGNNKEVQFNDGGFFGASSGFTFDKTNKNLSIGNLNNISNSFNSNIIGGGVEGVYMGSGSTNSGHTIIDSTSSVIIGGGYVPYGLLNPYYSLNFPNTILSSSTTSILNSIGSYSYKSLASNIIGSLGVGISGGTLSSIIGGFPSSPIFNIKIKDAINSSLIHARGSNIIYSETSGIIFSQNSLLSNKTRHSIIVGGRNNYLYNYEESSSIIGGRYNKLYYYSYYSTIIGGLENKLSNASDESLIIGGSGNTITSSKRSVIIGGQSLSLINQNDTVLVPKLTAFTISATTYYGDGSQLTGISGGTASGNYLNLSGGTVTGNTTFTQGLTAVTISATTYYGIKEVAVTPSILFVASPGSEYILDVSTSRTAKINLSNGANLNLKLSGITSAATGNIWLLQGSAGNSTLTLTGASYTNYVVNGGAGQISLSNSANAIDILSYITDGVNVFWSAGFNYT